MKTSTSNGTEITLLINDNYQIKAKFEMKGEKVDIIIDGWNALKKNQTDPDGIYGMGYFGKKRMRFGLTIPKSDWDIISKQRDDKMNIDIERAMNLKIIGFEYKCGCDVADQYDFVYEKNDIPFEALYKRIQSDKELIKIIENIDIDEIAKTNGAKKTESDMKSYYGWHFYGKAFDALIAKTNILLTEKKLEMAQKKELEMAQKKEKEERRKEFDIEILKISHKSGGECGAEPFAKIKIIDPKTGESAIFTCRNIFDFGYVINPEGGGLAIDVDNFISNNPYTFDTDEKKQAYRDKHPTPTGWGWDRFKKPWLAMTRFEIRAIKYLQEFPPITQEIRM